MEITTELIKELRDKTGVSVMQCKKALEEAGGDVEKATIVLMKKSSESASKKEGRELGAGVVESYIHNTKKVGVLVELMSETDFVAKNEEFGKLAKDIAMHIAASNPQFLSVKDVDEESRSKVREALAKEVEGKPEDMKEKIMEGKLDAYFAERVLLSQPFVKNPEVTIQNLIDQAIQKFGEKVIVSKFVRYSI